MGQQLAPEVEVCSAPFRLFETFAPTPLADSLRGALDAHFATPHSQTPETHQIWNYWYVPDLYAYMRTHANKLFAADDLAELEKRLRSKLNEVLCASSTTRLQVTFYVDGCYQEWHNDAGSGLFSFVYSLTRNDRRASGGETLIMRDVDKYLETLDRPNAGVGFFHVIPPSFNQLLVFDNRSPHSVRRVQGSMSPADGRFMVQGRVRYGGPSITGPLSEEQVLNSIKPAVEAIEHDAAILGCHGPLAMRFTIEPNGSVAESDYPYRRVRSRIDRVSDVVRMIHTLSEALYETKFPQAENRTNVRMLVDLGGN